MQDLLRPAIGDQIASFRIEALIGRGGMGLVFRARQTRPDRMVALKVIAPELASDDAFRARFEQESSVAAQIEHPNVIPVYEIGEDRGIVFIAMRFVNGTDLGELRRRSGQLEPAHATRLISQVASALDAAHARGLVHRDVKPGNMLVSGTNPEEHIYLTDFGLTKRNDASRGLTASGMYVGTLDYIAPEQVTGSRVDAPTDVYSLGCVLYELLAGQVPFPRETDAAKVFAHVSSQAPSLSECTPDVPLPLSRVVERAMAKSPAERYGSAGDFARAARETAAGPPRTVPRRKTTARLTAPFAKTIKAATATAKARQDDRVVAASGLESLTTSERAPAVADAESATADPRGRPTASPVPETSVSPAAETSTTPAPETSISPAATTSTPPAPKTRTTPTPKTSTTPAPETSTTPAPETSTTRHWPIAAAVGTAAIAAVTFGVILASGSGGARDQAKITGTRVEDPGPDPRVATQLSHALESRAGAVGAATARLGAAHLSARASGLRRVASEDEQVARAVTQISAPPRDVAPIAALAAGLEREAALTRELAAAAVRSNTRQYESLRGRLDASRVSTAGAGLRAVGFTRLPLRAIDVPRAPSRPRHRAAAPSATVPSASPEASAPQPSPVTQPYQPAHEESPASTPSHTRKKEESKTITTNSE